MCAIPLQIGSAAQEDSTWFSGYNEKHLFDKGAFFRATSKWLAKPLCIQILFRHKMMWKPMGISFFKAYKLMCDGAKEMSR